MQSAASVGVVYLLHNPSARLEHSSDQSKSVDPQAQTLSPEDAPNEPEHAPMHPAHNYQAVVIQCGQKYLRDGTARDPPSEPPGRAGRVGTG